MKYPHPSILFLPNQGHGGCWSTPAVTSKGPQSIHSLRQFQVSNHLVFSRLWEETRPRETHPVKLNVCTADGGLFIFRSHFLALIDDRDAWKHPLTPPGAAGCAESRFPFPPFHTNVPLFFE